MAMNLSPETLKKIEARISKFLGEQEQFRRHGTPASGKIIATVLQTAALFPGGTFVDNAESNLESYGGNLLRMQTEILWAFSTGTATEDLDCPQRAADLYHHFTQDLYSNWRSSGSKQAPEFAALYGDVTNVQANWLLITQDTTPREGNTNSPRAAMAAFAFIITNSMTSDREICNEAERLWRDRCGGFVTHKN